MEAVAEVLDGAVAELDGRLPAWLDRLVDGFRRDCDNRKVKNIWSHSLRLPLMASSRKRRVFVRNDYSRFHIYWWSRLLSRYRPGVPATPTTLGSQRIRPVNLVGLAHAGPQLVRRLLQ